MATLAFASAFASIISKSIDAGEPADFVRVFCDFVRYRREIAQPIPDDWRYAVADCLAKAGVKERKGYLVVLTELDVTVARYVDHPLLSGLSSRERPVEDTANASLAGTDSTSAKYEIIGAVLSGGARLTMSASES